MDFWPATLNQMKYQGDVHAMSISTIVNFMYYNKDRMREGGLDPDSPPTTIAELDAMGAELNEIADDGEILRLGFSPTLPGKQVWEWGAAFGSQYWDDPKAISPWDEEAWVELLNWYKSYGEQFGVENLAGYASTYGETAFGRNSRKASYTGLISFWVIGSWLFNDMGEYGRMSISASFPSRPWRAPTMPRQARPSAICTSCQPIAPTPTAVSPLPTT